MLKKMKTKEYWLSLAISIGIGIPGYFLLDYWANLKWYQEMIIAFIFIFAGTALNLKEKNFDK